LKYADDTYLIIPANNIHTCSLELSNISNWACNNNLQINRAKSAEIVFVKPRSRRLQSEPPSVISELARVESIKMLGASFSRKFSVSQHVDNLLAACSQSLFALRTVRQHGLPDDALHEVFQVVVIIKLTHASPAWWGFASADDRNRLEAFLRKCTKLGYRAKHSTTFANICDDADCKLFTCITGNTQHLLYCPSGVFLLQLCLLERFVWIVQCFTSPPTQYRLHGRRFLQVKRPNQQYQSTEVDATKEKSENTNNRIHMYTQ